tara:strand:- start:9793 stop:10224 length:432 start_codon:yes stop_codon:yes gene_type:complete
VVELNESLKFFNHYKIAKFKTIQQEVEEALFFSYEHEKEVWDELDEWEREEYSDYGAWWFDYIEWGDTDGGVYEYINELYDRYWSSDKVFLSTLNLNAGLDPKTVHDELVKLVFSTMAIIADIKAKKSTTTIFINWNENPFEV